MFDGVQVPGKYHSIHGTHVYQVRNVEKQFFVCGTRNLATALKCPPQKKEHKMTIITRPRDDDHK